MERPASPHGLVQRAILKGRALIHDSATYPSFEGLHAFALACGRGHDYAVVQPDTRFGMDNIRGRHRQPALPSGPAWDCLPKLVDWAGGGMPHPYAGTNYEAPLGDPMASVGFAFGPGQRLAPGFGPPRELQLRDILGDDRDGIEDPRPVLDLDAVASGRAITLVKVSPGRWSEWYFLWLCLHASEACERAGRAAPIIVCENRISWTIARLLGRSRISVNGGLVAVVAPDDPDASRDDDDLDALWDAVDRPIEARMRSGHADGVWWAEGDGRSVHAIRGWSVTGLDKPTTNEVFFSSVEADGRTSHVVARYRDKPSLSDAEIEDAVSLAWRTNVHLASTGFPTPSPLLRFHAEFVTHPALAALRGRLEARLGPWCAFDRTSSREAGIAETLWTWALAHGGDPERRRQFVESFRCLARIAFDAEVTEAVDAGRSPVPRIASLLGVGQTTVRALASTPFLPLETKRPGKPNWKLIGAILNEIGHGALPRQGAFLEWYWLGQRCQAVMRSKPDNASLLVRDMARLARGSATRERWLGMGRDMPWTGRTGYGSAQDFLGSLGLWLDAMAGGRRVDVMAVAADYGSIPDLLDATAAWHADELLKVRSHAVPPDARWPVPFAPVDLGNGWEARVLGSVRDLIAEGSDGPDEEGVNGLCHCVASYAGACQKGTSLILSLRRAVDGVATRVSTAQLRPAVEGDALVLGMGGKGYSVVQHKGCHNGDPGPGATAALARLAACLASGSVPIDADALSERFVPVGGLVANPTDLLPAWRRILPRRWARMDGFDLAERLPLVPEAPVD